MFLKNSNIISKIKRSKVTDYAALMNSIETNKMQRFATEIHKYYGKSNLCPLDIYNEPSQVYCITPEGEMFSKKIVNILYITVNSLNGGQFSINLSTPDFSKINFSKPSSKMPLECQTVWIQIRPDNLSGLIWVQSVCKGYQQTTPTG